MTKFGPGMYEHEGELHIDLPEMLIHFGYTDTENNRNMMIAAATEAVAEMTGKPIDVSFSAEPWSA